MQINETLNGLAVIAIRCSGHRGKGDSLFVVNGAGGLVGLGGMLPTTKMSDKADAFIAASTINSRDYGTDVIVRAHSD